MTQDVVFLQLPDSYIITHLSGSNFSGSSQNSGSLWIAKTGNVSSVSFGIFIPLMSISSKFDLLILVTKYLFLNFFFQYLDYRKSLIFLYTGIHTRNCGFTNLVAGGYKRKVSQKTISKYSNFCILSYVGSSCKMKVTNLHLLE